MSESGLHSQNGTQQWQYVLIGGFVSLLGTAISYWQTGSELSLTPVLFGGLLAGYLAKQHNGDSRGVGFPAGLIGGVPVGWIAFDILSATSALGGPSWFVASVTLLTIGFVTVIGVFGIGLAGVIGGVGGRVGGWLASKQLG